MFHVKHFCPVAQKIFCGVITIAGLKPGRSCDNFLRLGKMGNAAWADTTTAHGRLMLTILGRLADFERELIRPRTSEGRERAKAKGVKSTRRARRSRGAAGATTRLRKLTAVTTCPAGRFRGCPRKYDY